MPAIRVFEPALCCNTGVCGPDPDQALVGFTADLDHLKSQGADILRYNLANEPVAFAQSEPVRQFLQVAGSQGLPLVTVDGAVVLTGRYPSRAELQHYSGLAVEGHALLTVVGTTEGACCSPTAPATDGSACCGSAEPAPTTDQSACCGGAKPAAADASAACC